MEGGEGNNNQEVTKPLVLRKPDIKHRVLHALGAGVLGATLLGGPGQVKAADSLPQASSVGFESVESAEDNYLQRIKEFIVSHGSSEVSHEDAQAIVPDLAELYARSGSRLSSEQIANSTYFTRNEDSIKDIKPNSPEANPFFLHLKDDYPQSTIDAQTMWMPTLYQILGFESEEQVVLFLGNINKRDYSKIFQFDSIEQEECEVSTPAAVIVNAAVHEFGHQNVEGDWSNPIPLSTDGNLITHFQDVVNKFTESDVQDKDEIKVIAGAKQGFALYFDFGSSSDASTSAQWVTGLDEWTTQYLANKIVMENGFPALSVYGSGPKSNANFQAILEQSGISDQDLKELRRSSSIEDFLIKIADGAQGVEFQSDAEKVAFSFDLLNGIMMPSEDVTVWEESFKPYFPNVDIEFYKDHPQEIVGAPISCVVSVSQK